MQCKSLRISIFQMCKCVNLRKQVPPSLVMWPYTMILHKKILNEKKKKEGIKYFKRKK